MPLVDSVRSGWTAWHTGADFHGEKITICGTRWNEVILAMDKFLRTKLSGQEFPDKDLRISISGQKNKVDGRIMGNDAQAHIQGEISSSEWQNYPKMHAI